MKATIKFKRYGKIRQRTITVSENEPNSIIRELLEKDARVCGGTYITTVRCGRTEYQWFGKANEALRSVFD